MPRHLQTTVGQLQPLGRREDSPSMMDEPADTPARARDEPFRPEQEHAPAPLPMVAPAGRSREQVLLSEVRGALARP